MKKTPEMEVEDRLLDLGYAPITLMKIIGYFPYQHDKTGVKPLRLRSFTFFWSVLWVALILFSCYEYLAHLSFYSRQSHLQRPTDVVTYMAFTLMAIVSTTYCRLSNMGRSKSLSYYRNWVVACQVFGQWSQSDRFRFSKSSGKYLRWFDLHVKRLMSTGTLYVILQYVLLVSLSLTYNVLARPEIPPTTTRAEFYVTLIIWYACISLHGVLGLWYCFPVRIYSVYYMIAAEEIRGIREGRCGSEAEEEELLEECLQVIRTMEGLLSKSNDYFGVGIIIDIILSLVCSVTFVFFSVFWMSQQDWVHLGEACITIAALGGRIILFAENGVFLDRAVKTFREEMVKLSSGATIQGLANYDLSFRLQLLCYKSAFDPPIFSPAYFFKVDRKQLTKILAAATTYLVILLQFRQQDQDFL